MNTHTRLKCGLPLHWCTGGPAKHLFTWITKNIHSITYSHIKIGYNTQNSIALPIRQDWTVLCTLHGAENFHSKIHTGYFCNMTCLVSVKIQLKQMWWGCNFSHTYLEKLQNILNAPACCWFRMATSSISCISDVFSSSLSCPYLLPHFLPRGALTGHYVLWHSFDVLWPCRVMVIMI